MKSSGRRAFFLLRGGSPLLGFERRTVGPRFSPAADLFPGLCWNLLSCNCSLFCGSQNNLGQRVPYSRHWRADIAGPASPRQNKGGRCCVRNLSLVCSRGHFSAQRGSPDGLFGSAASAAVLSAWLLGRYPTVCLVLATILLGFVEATMEHIGHRLVGYFPEEPFIVWTTGSAIFLITVAPVLFAVENLRRQISARCEVEVRAGGCSHRRCKAPPTASESPIWRGVFCS